MPDPDGTIAAEATPPGRGSIRVVRLSGSEAGGTLRALFRPSGEAPWSSPRRLCLGDVVGFSGAALDRALAVFFAGPDSLTGEDVVELHLHGAPGVVRGVLDACQRLGARRALPGEFSFRAFLNGKLSLMAAEAVNALVSAESEAQAADLGRGLRGGLEGELRTHLDRILNLRAAWEASVDFPEDVDGGALSTERRALTAIESRLGKTLASARSLRQLREGWRIALVGPVNSGKSSLFNALLRRERALVTAHPGTTRDVLEETVEVAGYPLVLLDTAGFREASDPVEAMGQLWGREAARTADAALLVYDLARGWGADEEAVLRGLERPPLAILANKGDRARREAPAGHMRISASTGEGLEALVARLGAWMEQDAPRGVEVLTSERQIEAVARAREGCVRAIAALEDGHTEEVALQGLTAAQEALEELLTGGGTEDLYERIFSRFCIGK